MIRVIVIFIIGAIAWLEPVGGAWLEDIGYKRLTQRLAGDTLPEGRGISMTQVEATASGGGHLPQDGKGRFDGKDGFIGKSFHARSGNSPASEHARIVGHYLYASEPLASFGAVSLSPRVEQIDLFHAGVREYLGADFLVPRVSKPPVVEVNAIQNHSWYGQMGTASVDYMNDRLRRLDYSVSRDDYLCVVALANGADAPIPPLVASAFNVLTVGCSNGAHSHGYTHEALDGGARTKVDLVAPLSATSYATPVVSSAAALLLECAAEEDARHSEVLRAILMAGATTAPFPDWQRTETMPFDPLYGVGELRIDDSHQILTENQWHYNPSASARDEYALQLPDRSQDISIVLAWNRQGSFKRGKTNAGLVADMNLQLFFVDPVSGERELIQQSVSTNENREHVRARGLKGGRYVMVVESDEEVAYGMAWNVKPVSQPSLIMGADGLSAMGLKIGHSYEIEYSDNLLEWSADESFVAVSAAHDFAMPLQGFYRLAW